MKIFRNTTDLLNSISDKMDSGYSLDLGDISEFSDKSKKLGLQAAITTGGAAVGWAVAETSTLSLTGGATAAAAAVSRTGVLGTLAGVAGGVTLSELVIAVGLTMGITWLSAKTGSFLSEIVSQVKAKKKDDLIEVTDSKGYVTEGDVIYIHPTGDNENPGDNRPNKIWKIGAGVTITKEIFDFIHQASSRNVSLNTLKTYDFVTLQDMLRNQSLPDKFILFEKDGSNFIQWADAMMDKALTLYNNKFSEKYGTFTQKDLYWSLILREDSSELMLYVYGQNFDSSHPTRVLPTMYMTKYQDMNGLTLYDSKADKFRNSSPVKNRYNIDPVTYTPYVICVTTENSTLENLNVLLNTKLPAMSDNTQCFPLYIQNILDVVGSYYYFDNIGKNILVELGNLIDETWEEFKERVGVTKITNPQTGIDETYVNVNIPNSDPDTITEDNPLGESSPEITDTEGYPGELIGNASNTNSGLGSIESVTPNPDLIQPGDTPLPPIVPNLAQTSGLFSIFNPSEEEVKQFANFLWSNDTISALKNILSDPLDSIISFHKIFWSPIRQNVKESIVIGYFDSEVDSYKVISPYQEVDCGALSFPEIYGNFMDYDFTEMDLYLPFIGIVSVNPHDIIGRNVHIVYRCDCLTGDMRCFVYVKNENGYESVLYDFPSSGLYQIPITSSNFKNIFNGTLGSMISIASGSPMITGSLISNVYSTVQGPNVQKSGSFSGNSGSLGPRKPYFIVRRAIPQRPNGYFSLEGSPISVTDKIMYMSGYVKVQDVHLENFSYFTSEELDELEQILKSGVII